ncbi:MAG: 16S rRNA (adenine(1518)-N(6)/adenine(1519)-N(6))-dimethyltransferase RsmA [Candidatus Kapaibacteriota bacterium]
MKNIAPKKSLGQNFLTDRGVAKKIVESLDIQPNDLIVEIGPGTGALTEHILDIINSKVIENDLNNSPKLLAVELDIRAISDLTTKFSNELKNNTFKLINEDITKVYIEKEINILKDLFPHLQNVKVIGNLPYYITGQILDLILKSSNLFNCFIFMVQREVAERIVATKNTKDYSLLSLAVSLYGKPTKMFNVKPGSFFPAPKVTSSVVKIEFYNRSEFEIDEKYISPESIMKFAKISFSHRRKMLANTLKNYIENKTKKSLQEAYSEIDGLEILLKNRPENLDKSEFIKLYLAIEKSIGK